MGISKLHQLPLILASGFSEPGKLERSTYYTSDPSQEYCEDVRCVSFLRPIIAAYDKLFLSMSWRQ